MTAPRVLLCLGQMPQDPASGAARSLLTICEMLASAGFEVRTLGNTCVEGGVQTRPLDYLRAAGFDVQVDRSFMAASGGTLVYRFSCRGVSHSLVDAGAAGLLDWEHSHGKTFNRLFDTLLGKYKPDIMLTYGGSRGDQHRMRAARSAAAKIVFGLRNAGYVRHGNFFNMADAVLTPSAFLSDLYQKAIGLRSTALPLPLNLDDALAEPDDRPFFTFINPSVEKGLFFFVRLAEEIGTRRPDIPLLVIESRGTAGMVVQAGLTGGFDLRRHPNIMLAPAVARPRDIYRNTRVLLAPSVGPEAAGRVAAEAVLNGVPPIVSDRGGLAETANGGGFMLALPADLTLATRVPVGAAAVQPWVELIERLTDDEAFYAESAERAREAGKAYLPEQLTPRYAAFFRRVLAGLQTRPTQ